MSNKPPSATRFRCKLGSHPYDQAIEMLNHRRSGIRSGDALHLAVARNRGAQFVTLDLKLIRAARSLGVAADSVIALGRK